MVAHHQHIGGQGIGLPVRQHGVFVGQFGVAGQQQGLPLRPHPQHAAGVVVACAAVYRVEHIKAHAVPLPVLAGAAGLRGDGRAFFAQPFRLAGQQPARGKAPPQRGGAASVVHIAVRHHQAIQPRHAFAGQKRRNHPRAHIAGADSRASVVHQGVLRGAHHHRQALADVQHGDLRLASRRRAFGRAKQWQAQRQPQRAPGHPGRQAEHRHA